MTETLRKSRAGGLAGQTGQRIIIIGSGFGGLEVAKALGRRGLAATIVDRRNHHLFQPLLYQVATAALSPADVAEPVRRILRRYDSVQVLLGEVADIDRTASRVIFSDGFELTYDILVLAPGAVTGYFGHDEWAPVARGLKSIGDARQLRSAVLLAFEKAERALDPDEQQRLMTFAVVGGGPTGVELAGSLAELSRFALRNDYRNVRPESARIMIIEAGPRLLSQFSNKLSDFAETRLRELGVEIRTNTPVEDMGPGWIRIAGETLGAGVILWAAGVRASPLASRLGVETDRAGRIPVDPLLRVQSGENIFALGDAASCAGADGRPLPGLAQVAKQQGQHLGSGLAALLRDGTPLSAFQYHGRGNTAIIGRHAAVFEQGRLRLTGWIAWLAWAIIHVYLLVGFQHRILVSIQWLWRYLTYERGARLLTEVEEKSMRSRQRPQ